MTFVHPISDDTSVSVGERPKLVPPLTIGSSITLSMSLVMIQFLNDFLMILQVSYAQHYHSSLALNKNSK